MSDSDNDISWLTQESTLEEERPSFDIGYSYLEEDLVQNKDDLLISLEEQPSTSRGHMVIYDNMTCEDISSDDGLDSM